MNLAYYNDLWLIGPSAERRRAEHWLRQSDPVSPGDWDTLRAVFHPEQGHEVAATLCFDTPGRSFHCEAQEIAQRFPALQVMLAAVDQDGDSAGWTILHGGTLPQNVVYHHPSNDVDEVMHAQRRAWFPQVKALYEAVPFPEGSALEQASWRDDGNTVARLLQDPATRPDHPELWWAGLLNAARRPAAWIDEDVHHGRYLHGRPTGWTRSAVDAWMAAFPADLRDLDRLTNLWQNVDVSAMAALRHWIDPVTVYLRRPHDRPPLPDALNVLHLPLDLSERPFADQTEHLRVLAAMQPADRKEVLDHWWAQAVREDLPDEHPGREEHLLRTCERWHQQGWVPASWGAPATMARLATSGHDQLRAWLENLALQATLHHPQEGAALGQPPGRARPRL